MAPPAALHAHRAAVEHQVFRARQDGALLQMIRGLVAQFAGGFDRAFENGQKMLLDELDPAVPAHREQVHHLIEIAHRSGAGRACRRPRGAGHGAQTRQHE